ncbi:MAG: hypothetical protein ACLTC1_08160 [Turicibacter sp.]
MKTITAKEINSLYKKLNLDSEENYYINTKLNTGTLHNKLASPRLNNKINSVSFIQAKTTQN